MILSTENLPFLKDLLLDLCVEEIAPIRGIDTIIEEEREEEEEVRIQEYEQRHEQDEEQEVHLPSIIEGEERERKEEESSEEEDAITERVVEGPKKGSAGEDEGQRVGIYNSKEIWGFSF